jgi:hypothetical protein
MTYGIAGIVTFLAALGSWHAYAPPYRWIASLQQAIFGVDLVQISIFVTWALLYLPCHFVIEFVERRRGLSRDPVTWTRLVAFAEFLFEQRPGQVMLVGIIVAAMGGWFWTRNATTGPLTELSIEAAAAGQELPSRFIRLTGGKVLTDSELSFTRNRSVERYYPVVPKDRPLGPVRAFVRLDTLPFTGEAPTELVGTVEPDGLPGPLRAHIEERGLLAPKSFVLLHGRQPGSESDFFAKMTLFGVAAIAAGGTWASARRRRAA